MLPIPVDHEAERARLARMTPQERAAEARRVGKLFGGGAIVLYVGVMVMLAVSIVNPVPTMLTFALLCLVCVPLLLFVMHEEFVKARKEENSVAKDVTEGESGLA